MAVVATAEVPGVTHEMYEQINELLGITAENPPDGLVYHLAVDTDGGMRMIDVWESAEKFTAFIESNAAKFEQAGVPPFEPQIMPVHNTLDGEGNNANVAIVIEAPGLTTGQYDDLASRMPSHQASRHPSVSHAAAVADGGLFIVDVWDSPQNFQRFAETEIADAAGGQQLPMEISVYPIYNRIEGKARVSA
jgi:hypothetical protein